MMNSFVQWTLLAIDKRCTASLKPIACIMSLALLQSLRCHYTPLHASFSPYNYHLNFSQVLYSTPIHNYWPCSAVINSPFLLWGNVPPHSNSPHSLSLPPPTCCSGSHSRLTSSTCTHSVTKLGQLPYCFRSIT